MLFGMLNLVEVVVMCCILMLSFGLGRVLGSLVCGLKVSVV